MQRSARRIIQNQDMSNVTDNTQNGRFELVEEGLTAFAEYRRLGDRVVINHVEAPMALRGRGTAGRLMEGVAALGRENGWRFTLRCSYASAWFRRHPEFGDMVG